MLERAASKGVAAERLVFLRNWVDVDAIRPLDRPSAYRRELGLAGDAVVVLFSGTLGSKQGLQLIPESARLLARDASIQFVICGEGPMKAELLRQGPGLANLHFLPLQPVQRLGELLGLADIHLLPQDAAAEDLVLPSKLGGMLASGRPVVATCRADTELHQLVARAGFAVPPNDAAALAAQINALAGAPELRHALGRQARELAEGSFGMARVLQQFERDLAGCLA